MDRNEEVFEITKTMSNIRNHDFTVADYKMCPQESDVVLRALEHYKKAIEFNKLSVADIFSKLGDDIKRFDDSTRKMQLFDIKE